MFVYLSVQKPASTLMNTQTNYFLIFAWLYPCEHAERARRRQSPMNRSRRPRPAPVAPGAAGRSNIQRRPSRRSGAAGARGRGADASRGGARPPYPAAAGPCPDPGTYPSGILTRDPESRRALTRKNCGLKIGFGCRTATPIGWNFQHAWPSFGADQQQERTANASGIVVQNGPDQLAGQGCRR